jgi:hypothetical protein
MRHRNPANDFRIQRSVEHLHRLGARATTEAFLEVAELIGDSSALLEILERYRRLNPDMIRVAGGDRFPTRLRQVA